MVTFFPLPFFFERGAKPREQVKLKTRTNIAAAAQCLLISFQGRLKCLTKMKIQTAAQSPKDRLKTDSLSLNLRGVDVVVVKKGPPELLVVAVVSGGQN